MEIDFKKTIDSLQGTGLSLVYDRVNIAIPNAKRELLRGLNYFTDENGIWLPEYEAVAAWLSCNNGRGLLCQGNCGRGKTLICGKIIPSLLLHYHKKIVSCYNTQQMNADIDDVKRHKIIYIDDVGEENVSVKYGERRMAFPEIVDEAEKCGKLLLLTTNCTVEELEQKYGVRTMDRLVAITKLVKFKGESLRK